MDVKHAILYHPQQIMLVRDIFKNAPRWTIYRDRTWFRVVRYVNDARLNAIGLHVLHHSVDDSFVLRPLLVLAAGLAHSCSVIAIAELKFRNNIDTIIDIISFIISFIISLENEDF